MANNRTDDKNLDKATEELAKENMETGINTERRNRKQKRRNR